MKYLGETIDIHCGAVDLLFPHHENEIAQSEGATGKKFVNYWLEGEHLLLSGQKMAKSLGNIVTLENLKKFHPLAFRYLCLTTHYRTKLNFTLGGLEAADRTMINLGFQISNLLLKKTSKKGRMSEKYKEKFVNAINNDLDTPKALAIFWELMKSNLSGQDILATLLEFDKVLGLRIDETIRSKDRLILLPEGAQSLIDKRDKLRKEGNFKEADKIRNELKKMEVEIEDTEKGPVWKVKV
jgi:cysteinyl-tRNA synthetase